MGELTRTIVSNDTELQKAIRSIVRDAVNQARRTLRHGTEADKNSLMKVLLPYMLEALRQTNQSEEDRKSTEAYKSMMKMLRGET